MHRVCWDTSWFVLLLLASFLFRPLAPVLAVRATAAAASTTSNATTTTNSAAACHPHSLRIPPEALPYRRSPALVIAHRGASYHLPEHTLAAYRLALELGADFCEPDLVPTQDGVLVALHTLDLNVTTDVVTKFGSTRQPWFSPTAGRAGYWTFNFTWDEIQTLTVKQRLPRARTTALDGMFGIPSLAQILDTLHQWNEVDLPARFAADDVEAPAPGHPSPLQKYRSGVYIEFKETEWIQRETGMDLVDLLFQSVAHAFRMDQDVNDDNDDDNPNNHAYWRDLLSCYETVRFDEYLVPGLVLQSFAARDLQRFHEKWNADDDSRISTAAAEPPYVLLAKHPTCWMDAFWLDVGEEWRSFLSGIGCEKTCVLGTGGGDGREVSAFLEKAEQFQLVLHPWTERPEHEYVSSEAFASSAEEVQHLLCQTPGVHGLFTESVDAVVRTVCKHDDDDTAVSGNQKVDVCDQDSQQQAAKNAVFVGLGSFAVGMLAAVLMSFGVRSYRNQRQQQKFANGRSTRVPTMEDEDRAAPESDLEFA